MVKIVVTKILIELEFAGLGLAAVNLAKISGQLARIFDEIFFSTIKKNNLFLEVS